MKTTTIKALAIGLAVSSVSLSAHAQDAMTPTECVSWDFLIEAHDAAQRATDQNNHAMDTSTAWNNSTSRHFKDLVNAQLALCGLPPMKTVEDEQ